MANISMRSCFPLCCLLGYAAAAGAAGVPERAEAVTSVVRTDAKTGKLRRVVQGSPTVRKFQRSVERIAAKHALPPELLQSVIKTESNYDPYAISPKGALGLMQLIPSTARRFGVSDAFDPVENIEGGARYLRYLLDLFEGDYSLALAAYNAGEGAVSRYGDVPPYAETREYVKRVGQDLDLGADPKGAAPSQGEDAEAPSGPAHIEQIVDASGAVRYVSR